MVGYFFTGDLLGFSQIIKNSTDAELHDRINIWIKLVEDAAKENSISNFQLISDTVFAYTDSSPAGLNNIILFAKYLLEVGIKSSLPIRGAITHGNFTWGKLIYGKAVIEAHKLEMEQNWIGVSCGSTLPHLGQNWPKNLICYCPPKKQGPILLQPVVLWDVPTTEVLHKFTTDKGLTLKGEVLDWQWGEKVTNTISYKSYLHLVKLHKLPQDKFHGFQPMHFIDNIISSLKT